MDLSACDESEKADAWQGETSLEGVLVFGSYTSHTNYLCQVDAVAQGWPVLTEPGWWCGVVVEQCVCAANEGCT